MWGWRVASTGTTSDGWMKPPRSTSLNSIESSRRLKFRKGVSTGPRWTHTARTWTASGRSSSTICPTVSRWWGRWCGRGKRTSTGMRRCRVVIVKRVVDWLNALFY
uniref:(northern house mosquito) hypothetical protein n=1 Tax=Culex pipiens TaxID=7175 RepID=A0A8D8L7B5_CULPI